MSKPVQKHPAPASARIEQQKTIVLLIAGLLLSLALTFLFNREESVRMRADLFPLWNASRAFLDSGRSIYDVQNGTDMLAQFNNTVHLHDGLFFYPATILLFILPLAALPYDAAHFIWTLCVQWMFYLGTWLLMASVNWPKSVNQRTLVLVLGIVSIPIWQHTIWSQFNAIATFSLGASYWALRKGRLGMAGALAAGLTFKPQATLAPLIFLTVWALLDRKRWRLLASLAAASLGLWLFAEALQPGWVAEFLAMIRVYANSPRYPIGSITDLVWNPYQVTTGLLLLSMLALTLFWRRAEPGSAAFCAILVYSVAIGWLSLPVLGMIHLVTAPGVVVLLLSAVEEHSRTATRKALFGILALYAAGIVLFILGLLRQYGLHIEWTELAYKALLPSYLCAIALWLLFHIQAKGQRAK